MVNFQNYRVFLTKHGKTQYESLEQNIHTADWRFMISLIQTLPFFCVIRIMNFMKQNITETDPIFCGVTPRVL